MNFIGTYDIERIVGEPAIHQRLQTGFGDKYLTFLADLSHHGPWEYIDICLSIEGSLQHVATSGFAILAVCPYDGEVHAAVRDEGELTLLSTTREYRYLPSQIRRFIEQPAAASKPPPGLAWKH